MGYGAGRRAGRVAIARFLSLIASTILSLAAAVPSAHAQSDAAAGARSSISESALRALYPGLARDWKTVGEAFASRSLGKTAADMRLLAARLVPFGESSGLVVSLLEPIGLSDGYCLIELGVLARDADGAWRRLRNLKVRVDDGKPAQDIVLEQPALVGSAQAKPTVARPIRFVVPLMRRSLRIEHVFGWDGKRLKLVETRYPKIAS